MNKYESKYFNTAMLIDQALIELLNKKDYEYITVKEICKKAGVNRSTFYLHYENIDDLLHESIEYINKKFSSYFPDTQNRTVKDIQNSELEDLIFITKDYLLPYLNYIKENKTIYSVSIKHPARMQSVEKYNLLNKSIFFPILKRFGIDDKFHKYFSAYYINGIIAIINEWLKDDCREDIDCICDIIIQCVNHTESKHEIIGKN